MLLFLACNPGTDSKTTPEGNADSTNKTLTAPARLGITEGALDILVADSASFAAVTDNKLVFSFTFAKPDSLTIHGWSFHGIVSHRFDSLPNLKLHNTSIVEANNTYFTDTYFGNLILSDVDKIQRRLKDLGGKFVLFVPVKLGNNIKYEIRISTESPYQQLSPDKYATTSFSANPSPPKND